MKILKQTKTNTFRLLTILLLLLLGYNHIDAQEEKINNSIYISTGTIIFHHQFSIAYERTVYSREYLYIRAKAHYGTYTKNGLDLDDGEKKYKNQKGVSGVLLFQMFELNLGLVFTQYTLAKGDMSNPDIDYSLVRNGIGIYTGAGIRYEDGGFVVRAGFNNFEYLYAGVGIYF